MKMLEAALKEAGVREVRRASNTHVLGRLDVPDVGLVRAVACRNRERFDAQMQFRPLKLGEAARLAVADFLEIVCSQVQDSDFSAGMSEQHGVIWLCISGRLEDAPAKAAMLTGIARLALKPLDALCRDEALARLYVQMQTRGAG